VRENVQNQTEPCSVHRKAYELVKFLFNEPYNARCYNFDIHNSEFICIIICVILFDLFRVHSCVPIEFLFFIIGIL